MIDATIDDVLPEFAIPEYNRIYKELCNLLEADLNPEIVSGIYAAGYCAAALDAVKYGADNLDGRLREKQAHCVELMKLYLQDQLNKSGKLN